MKENHTRLIKKKAIDFGFMACGISKAEFLEEEASSLEKWLKSSLHANMGYMENNFDKRLDPTLLVEGSKSVISLLYNYYPKTNQPKNSYKIARYAYGKDYHKVIKEKLKKYIIELQSQIGNFHSRIFVDSAPILERAWAKKSGLGWVGKNTQLITKKSGSYYFLAEIITDLDLISDIPTSDHCGSCNACIEACPTQAILAPYILDSNKCISYLTIENKNEISNKFKQQMNDWIFGCDICQEVCPWNRFSTENKEPDFEINDFIKKASKIEWERIDEQEFKFIFRKSPLKRTNFKGIKRNISFVSQMI